MTHTDKNWRADFEQAMGETFGDAIAPLVEFEDASAHECCEVVRSLLGNNVTPRLLAQITDAQVVALSRKFEAYFECESPFTEKIREAIERTLARWPVGSLGE